MPQDSLFEDSQDEPLGEAAARALGEKAENAAPEEAATVKTMAMLEHLAELRLRLLYSAGAVLLGMGVAFLFAEPLYAFLVQPLAEASSGEARRMIYTGLTEAFFTYLKLSFYAGLAAALPFIALQAYLFTAPGLYKNEKQSMLLFLLLSPVLFLTGAALAYYGVFPLAWNFFLSFEAGAIGGLAGIELEARVSEYLTLVLQLLFAFGLAFQLPLVLVLLNRMGLVQVESLRKGRKYAVILIFVAAALFTPPDVISQIALAIPLLLLYELAILLCRAVDNKAENP